MNNNMAMFRDSFWGLNGFEELRKYIKQGNEFCKEVSTLMLERSELEMHYGKVLNKLAGKLSKSATNCIGTLASAWSAVAVEMQEEAELHKNLGQMLSEEVYKPLKVLAENQHKARKPVESMVNKALQSLTDRRSEEQKAKKLAFSSAKEREKLSEQLAQARAGKGKSTEKDISKLQKRVNTSDELLRKTDRDYHNVAIKAEGSREDWETAVYKASIQMQMLEETRINEMHKQLQKIYSCIAPLAPRQVQSCERLNEAVICVDLNADLRTIVDQKGTGPNQPNQHLLECYAEDFANSMDVERRRDLLQSYMLYLTQSIEVEEKGREGVEKLMDVYRNKPGFADQETQDDTQHRLVHLNSMLSFLRGSQYKISCALAHLNGKPKPDHQYSQYIEKTRDKQGLSQSILKLPISLLWQTFPNDDYRGAADGGQPDPQYDARTQSVVSGISVWSADDDEFETYEGDDAAFKPPEYNSIQNSPEGRCEAIYEYTAGQQDELTIKPGDVINVYQKQQDDWWQGELNGKVGLFPATYVQMIPS
ncbi:unnamed protein product [Owenia fusiformis]|uniref:Uncharacterized protein n=1 Tax=Owenia fusiformis TaxID=6347 RepID=A0A8J1UJ52_OWEFU|nr:unnamed protein product [Owenia fusiformis]